MNNFEELREKGIKFSFDEIKIISKTILGALDYADKRGCTHTDVKPENLGLNNKKVNSKGKKLTLEERIWVGDFEPWFKGDWGPDQRDYHTRNHVSGTALVIKELLDNRKDKQKKVPSGFMKVIEKAEAMEYDSPGDFKEALDSYPRREAIKNLVLLVGGAIVSVGIGLGVKNHIDYKDSIGYIIDEIDNTSVEDHKTLSEQFLELGVRICNKKIKKLYSEENIERGFFPHATDEQEKRFMASSNKYIAGYSIKILRTSASLTGDSLFNDKADRLAKKITYGFEDEEGFNPTRFLHAGKQIPEAASYFEGLFNNKLEGYDLSSAYSKYFDSPAKENEIVLKGGSTSDILPLLMAASQELTGDKSEEYFDNLIKHTELIERYSIREDNSTRDLVKANLITHEIEEDNKHAYAPEGCFARDHVGMIDWFVNLFELTKNQHYLDVAKRLQGYYIDHLPENGVPFSDLSYEYREQSSKKLLRDTSAQTKNCRTLAHLTYNLNINIYEDFLYKSFKSLTPYISRDEDSDIIISEGCANLNTEEYQNSCLIWGVSSFLEAIDIIKRKKS